jgi:uncharacterized protein YaaN involved in tellurite resistance
MSAFDAVRSEGAEMPAEALNDDHVYKQKLNQVRVMDLMSSRYVQVATNPEPLQSWSSCLEQHG